MTDDIVPPALSGSQRALFAIAILSFWAGMRVDEMFVHHEDVRRTQTGWEPRQLDARAAAAVKRRVAIIGRAGMSKSMAAVPARVTLQTPDGQTVAALGSGPSVTATGNRWSCCCSRSAATSFASTSTAMTTSSPRYAPRSEAFERSGCPADDRSEIRVRGGRGDAGANWAVRVEQAGRTHGNSGGAVVSE